MATESGGSTTALGVFEEPPSVDDLATSLRAVLRRGMPVSDQLLDDNLLCLRGVVARSINPSDRLSRVKAFNELLGRFLSYYSDDVLAAPARTLFGVSHGSRGTTLTARRSHAARLLDRDPDHFRKHIEPTIIRSIAWQLYSDSLNYAPRARNAPPPLEISGDTPYISSNDVSSRDRAIFEEALSRLWSYVYGTRADIIHVERLKSWPYDETDPELSLEQYQKAVAARSQSVQVLNEAVEEFVARHGPYLTSGNAEFIAEALRRLLRWNE